MFAGYRIEGMIDRGGMGVVYKATDPDLDRTVALKIIAPEHTQNEDAVARFKAEARLAASLEHPNIVPIHRGRRVRRRALPRDAVRAGHQPARDRRPRAAGPGPRSSGS